MSVTKHAEQSALDGVKALLYADVIDCTIGVMMRLRSDLQTLSGATLDPNSDLIRELQNLTSESIREALHRGELGITNGVITAKNAILRKLDIEIPESHLPIDGNKYGNYRW